jgi:hypothetical protein
MNKILIILMALFVISSCNSTGNRDTKDKSESYTQESDTLKDCTVTLSLTYTGIYGQILQFTPTDLQCGIGQVLLGENGLIEDIRWNESDYAVRQRKLTKGQMDIIQKIISGATALKFKDDEHVVKDGIIFTLYIKNKEVARGWVNILDLYPKNIQQTINELIEIEPLLPEILEGVA